MKESTSKGFSLLFHEAKIYNELAGARKCTGVTMCEEGIPEVYYVGVEGDYNVLVMELLGPNLEDLRVYCQGKFSLPTTANLAEQMVSLILTHKA